MASGGRLGEPKALSPEASSLTARLPDQRMAHSEGGGRSHAAELDGGAVAAVQRIRKVERHLGGQGFITTH